MKVRGALRNKLSEFNKNAKPVKGKAEGMGC
jgi:hypothetical protein